MSMSAYKYTPEIVYDYVEEIDPNLTCAICQSALVDPVTTTSCKHTFCRDCIGRAISVNPQCPIDRSALTLQSLNDTEQLVKLMLDELKVRCAADECGMIMQRGLLLGHLRTCQKAVITCGDADCGLSMARQKLPHHRAYECFQRTMECRKCGVLLKFRDRTAHVRPECQEPSDACELCHERLGALKHLHGWSCPRARVPCAHSARGCPALVPRQELDAHLAACPFEAMSHFFAMNDARFTALEKRNDALESEVGRLRAELRDVRGNVSVARMSLGSLWRRDVDGPWARAIERTRRDDITPNTDISPPNSEPTTATAVPPDLSGSPEGVEVDPPSSSTTTDDNISLSFPSLMTGSNANSNTDVSAYSPSRHFPSAPFTPSQSHADYAFSRLGISSVPSVAMQGLDEILSGLRAVAVNLAAGLDTMERRNEVRTMTESLRVLEEVGSLRAIVSAMRMQAMMDRPSSPAHLRPPALNRSPFSPNAPTPDDLPLSQRAPAPISPMTDTTITRSTTTTDGTATATSTSTNTSMGTHTCTSTVPSSSTHSSNVRVSPALETDETDGRAPSVRESVVFSDLHGDGAGRGSSSTSSLVTAGAVSNFRGRPMGLPTPGQWEFATITGEATQRQQSAQRRWQKQPQQRQKQQQQPPQGRHQRRHHRDKVGQVGQAGQEGQEGQEGQGQEGQERQEGQGQEGQQQQTSRGSDRKDRNPISLLSNEYSWAALRGALRGRHEQD